MHAELNNCVGISHILPQRPYHDCNNPIVSSFNKYPTVFVLCITLTYPRHSPEASQLQHIIFAVTNQDIIIICKCAVRNRSQNCIVANAFQMWCYISIYESCERVTG